MQIEVSRFRRGHVKWTILSVLVIELLLLFPLLVGWAEFDRKVGIVVFATVPAFVVTVVQLVRTHQVQRAAYVKDFLAEFHKNTELYGAFYDLVYRFRDDLFARIDEIAQGFVAQHGKPEASQKPIFDCFADVYGNAEPGCRFFHPQFFQFSPEEKRLDGVLDYFNAVGLYVYEGLIRIEDVVTVLGDYLAVMADRKIVKKYMELCTDPDAWKYDDTVGASLPYQHLRYLLEAYKEYNLKAYHIRRTKQLQHDIDEKKKEVAALEALQEELQRRNPTSTQGRTP